MNVHAHALAVVCRYECTCLIRDCWMVQTAARTLLHQWEQADPQRRRALIENLIVAIDWVISEEKPE